MENEKFTFNLGYILLPVELDFTLLPETFSLQEQTFHKIDSYPHVSVVCTKHLQSINPDMEDVDIIVWKSFQNFIQDYPIEFTSFTGEIRHAQSPADTRQSIIAMCTISNLEKFFDHLETTFNMNVDYSPTHVTLFTLQQDMGIGLHNQKYIDDLTTDITGVAKDAFKDFLTQ